jgi:hypothetical protein
VALCIGWPKVARGYMNIRNKKLVFLCKTVEIGKLLILFHVYAPISTVPKVLTIFLKIRSILEIVRAECVRWRRSNNPRNGCKEKCRLKGEYQ